jgi:F420-0:gamma-glutamyl ligase
MDLSLAQSNNKINPAYGYITDNDKKEKDGRIIPYGFNGVFTKKKNGSAILNGGISLYSPSGIYPGNDDLSSNVVKEVLKQSANLEIANIITDIINLPPKAGEDISIGKRIDNAFKE